MRKLTCCLFALCIAGSALAADDTSFAGTWWGTLDVGVKLRLVFRVQRDGSAYKATVASIDQSPKELPVDKVTVAGDGIELDMPMIAASFAGKRADRDHVKGTFTQRGVALPLELQRGEPVAQVRPQEPKPPFPYAVENVKIENRAAGVSLGCTLTHPTSGRFPVVVFITGSGQQDRDENILGHKPFLLLADALARKGIGGLRCDDRGKGESTGDFARSTTLDFAGDVEAELAWLAARPDADGKHLGLLGHSEGGLIAPIVAARNPKVAFVVLLAGPAQRGDALIEQQQVTLARMAGMSAEQVAAANDLEKKLIAAVETEKDDAEALARMKALVAGAPEPLRKQILGDAGKGEALSSLLSPWLRQFLTLDPRPHLEKLKVPVLALFGSRDIQVPPADNIGPMKQALADDRDVTVKELPGLNHLFQHCSACTVGEYGTNTQTMDPEALQLMVDWIAKHAR